MRVLEGLPSALTGQRLVWALVVIVVVSMVLVLRGNDQRLSLHAAQLQASLRDLERTVVMLRGDLVQADLQLKAADGTAKDALAAVQTLRKDMQLWRSEVIGEVKTDRASLKSEVLRAVGDAKAELLKAQAALSESVNGDLIKAREDVAKLREVQDEARSLFREYMQKNELRMPEMVSKIEKLIVSRMEPVKARLRELEEKATPKRDDSIM